MNITILLMLFGGVLLSGLLALLTKNKKESYKKIAIALFAFAVFLTYLPTLLSDDAIINAFNIFDSPWIFSNTKTILLQILRLLTISVFLIASLIPFTKSKNMGNLMLVFAVPVALLNLVFIEQNIHGMYGLSDKELFSGRVLYFIFMQIFTIAFATYLVLAKTNRIYFKNKKKVLKDIGKTLPLILLISVPTSTFQMLFGFIGVRLTDFSNAHRLILYASFILPVILYIALRNKSDEEKYLAMLFVSLVAFVHFYAVYEFPFPWNDVEFSWRSHVPLHLCNAAMVLIPVSLMLKSKKIFYFTYFFNVMGALVAIVLPETSGDIFRNSNMHYWYEHIAAFYIPILVVALKVMPRPSGRVFKWAVGVFTIYFFTVLFLNVYGSAQEGRLVNYFFLNDDTFIGHFPWARAVRDNYALAIRVGDYGFIFYPVYQAVIYFAFIFLSTILWAIYEYSYKISDGLEDLYAKKKIRKIDNLAFLSQMGNRKLSEPINKGGVDMLKISNLTKIYGKSDVKALDDFSLEVKNGEVFGFLGHNGAGKSTTIKSMVGVLPPTSGNVEIFGYDIVKQPLEAKKNIGYVPDNHAVYERLTGREYVNYVADLYNVSKENREKRLSKYLKIFSLEHAIDNQIKTYSHGMKQKITLIAALVHSPKLWVLDEPLTGLDPTSAFQVKEALRKHADEGNIVFFSSHVIDVVEKICDRIAIVNKGKLVCVKDLKEMAKKGESLERLYLEIVEGNNNDS